MKLYEQKLALKDDELIEVRRIKNAESNE